MKNILPKLWRTRIIAKLILSRLPFSYRFWSKLNLFRHGEMDNHYYAGKILHKHSQVLDNSIGWKGLEIGPGDGLLSAFLSPAFGASEITLVDIDDFAHKNIDLYKESIKNFILVNPELKLPDYSNMSSIHDMLNYVGASYHCEGLDSLRKLNENSYDLIFSQSVIEHIKYSEFQETMLECYRLLKTGGNMSHWVDFKDHLGGGLNNMRISSSLWEKEWFGRRSGFYTNRIKMKEIFSICHNIGFNVKSNSIRRWETIPIDRHQLAEEYKNVLDDDLIISGAHLVMTK